MCCGRQIGLVRDWVEKELVDFNDVFKISNDRIEINPELTDYDSRSQVGQLDLNYWVTCLRGIVQCIKHSPVTEVAGVLTQIQPNIFGALG